MSSAADKAKQVKSILSEKLNGLPWFRGVGTARDTQVPTLRINVDGLTEEISQHIKSLSQEVPIIVSDIGNINAL